MQHDVLGGAAVDEDRRHGGLATRTRPVGAGRRRGERKPCLAGGARVERGLVVVVPQRRRARTARARPRRRACVSVTSISPVAKSQRSMPRSRCVRVNDPFRGQAGDGAGGLPARSSPARSSRSRSAACSSGLGIPLRRVGQLVDRPEPEQLEEERRGPVQDRAELRAAGLLDQAALDQRGRRRLRRDAADARDLGPRDRLQVGDDRQRLGLRGRQARRARAGEQPPRGLLGVGVRAERPAAGELAQHEPATVERDRQRAQPRGDLVLLDAQRVGELLDRDRVGREEQQRLELSLEVHQRHRCPRSHARHRLRSAGAARSARTVIGPNDSSCSQSASPRL